MLNHLGKHPSWAIHKWFALYLTLSKQWFLPWLIAANWSYYNETKWASKVNSFAATTPTNQYLVLIELITSYCIFMFTLALNQKLDKGPPCWAPLSSWVGRNFFDSHANFMAVQHAKDFGESGNLRAAFFSEGCLLSKLSIGLGKQIAGMPGWTSSSSPKK